MQWRSWFRLLPGIALVSRIRSGVGVQWSRGVEFLGWVLDPTGSVRGGCERPTATRRVERTGDSDEQRQFRLAFVAPGLIEGGCKWVSAEQPRCHNSCRRSRKTRRDAVRATPLTVVAGVMFRCAAVADPVVTIGGTAVDMLWPESETPY